MTTTHLPFPPKRPRIWVWLATCALAAANLGAQTPAARIQTEVSSSTVATLQGSLHPLAQAQYDAGRVPADTRLNGISIVFNHSAAQQADLEALIAAQQNPSSPLYHQWLTPDQFAARFGMAQSDLAKVETWLEQQGFSIDSVARSRNMIRFSGSVNQVEQAFQTQMHFYTIGGEKHFAPSTALMIPSALAPVVLAVRNLDDFRPKPMIEKSRKIQANPAFTSSVSGGVFFAPPDIKVAYGINPLISAGDIGTGQSIAIMGQSSILNSDIENFENAAGLTVKDPNLVLVPGSGTPEAFAGDQGESDLDIEWSGGIAPGAEIFFVYTGSSTNFGVLDSMDFAVDEKIGNIISISYGSCEPEMPAGSASAYDAVLAQAATQGQTVIASAGDSGSSGCYEGVPTTSNGFPPLATQEQLAVSYPASSQYVTGVGGTEITAADDVSTNSTYWLAQSTSDQVLSLKTYIPEVAWNDDLLSIQTYGATSLSATGGGVSTLYTTKPSWQTGVPGIPADGKRDVPDVSFYASPELPGYLFCTSDTSDWQSGQAASCNSGFRDSSTNDLNVAGGTSFATPIFAGMVAILNQTQGYSDGQGLINPTLYKLASNSTTYAAAFHDVTTGNNECPSSLGANYCSTASEGAYATTTGYDQVTGLGSVNLSALVVAWPATTSTLIGTTTSVSAATATPTVSTNDTITITVASDSGTTTPTGTVNLSIDQTLNQTTNQLTGGTTTSVTLAANGTATYTANFATTGIHSIVAQYAGDTTHAASSGSVSINIAGTSSGKGTIALAATNVSVPQGTSASSTITVTPAGGYTGTVYLTFDTSNDSALANLCYEFSDTLSDGDGSVTVAGTTPATTQLTLDTNASDCVSAAIAKSGKHAMHRLGPVKTSQNNSPSRTPLAVAFAGLLLAGFMGRSSRKLRNLAAVIALLALGLGLSACGSGSVSTTVSNPPKGTYTLTVSGQDSTTATISATTKFTLTID